MKPVPLFSSAESRYRFRRIHLLLPLGLVILGGVSFLWVDIPVIQWIQQKRSIPGDLRRIIDLFEFFGFGVTAACFVLMLPIFDKTAWRFVPFLLISMFGSGLMATILKMTSIRIRPHYFFTEIVPTLSAPPTCWDTFRVLPFSNELATYVGSGASWERSFPSGHTASVCGLMMAMSMCYSGRYAHFWFVLIAILAGGQRVVSMSHYPSDVFVGAALGCAVVMVLSAIAPYRTRWINISTFVHRRNPRS